MIPLPLLSLYNGHVLVLSVATLCVLTASVPFTRIDYNNADSVGSVTVVLFIVIKGLNPLHN